MSAKVKADGKSRKELREAEWRRRQIRERVTWTLAGVVVLAFVGYILWNEFRPKPSESVLQLSAAHVQPGAPHEAYNTNPPTSGAHYTQPAKSGFYNEAIADETLVHNLEHGYVIVWYNCANLDEAQCQALKTQIGNVVSSAGRHCALAGQPI